MIREALAERPDDVEVVLALEAVRVLAPGPSAECVGSAFLARSSFLSTSHLLHRPRVRAAPS
jgi:hypothetical protein